MKNGSGQSKAKIDELMRRYDRGEIDGNAYANAMLELTASDQA